jgi:hypothetical protein
VQPYQLIVHSNGLPVANVQLLVSGKHTGKTTLKLLNYFAFSDLKNKKKKKRISKRFFFFFFFLFFITLLTPVQKLILFFSSLYMYIFCPSRST